MNAATTARIRLAGVAHCFRWSSFTLGAQDFRPDISRYPAHSRRECLATILMWSLSGDRTVVLVDLRGPE